jgi:pimeloyl-ACP methyl ester carboxylesterase
LALFGLLQAPAFGQPKKENPKDPPKKVEPPRPTFKHLDGRNIVFVVDGAANGTIAGDHLRELNDDRQLGLVIRSVPWCRHNAAFEDLVDVEAQTHAAVMMARSVAAIRKDAPNARIFFVAHSVGTHVALMAAEMSPPKSIDRVILLHPAVSCTYDLTLALKNTRMGIDNFWSSEDSILDAMVQHKATADGQKVPAAGRVGFQLASRDKKDIEAYRAVRQYGWSAEYAGSGGHLAWALRHNMKKVMVPMFFCPPPEPPAIIKPKMPGAK